MKYLPTPNISLSTYKVACFSCGGIVVEHGIRISLFWSKKARVSRSSKGSGHATLCDSFMRLVPRLMAMDPEMLIIAPTAHF